MIALSNLDKQLKQQENSNNLLNDLIESIQNARIQFSQEQCNTQKLLTLILIQNQHTITWCSLCPWQIRCSKYWKLSMTYHMATWNTWGQCCNIARTLWFLHRSTFHRGIFRQLDTPPELCNPFQLLHHVTGLQNEWLLCCQSNRKTNSCQWFWYFYHFLHICGYPLLLPLCLTLGFWGSCTWLDKQSSFTFFITFT